MHVKWLSTAVALAALTVPVIAQIHVFIGGAPPPLRYEARPPMPGEGYSWIDGYWGDNGGRYVWIPGRWDRPPYPGAVWNHPHYDHYDRGWQMHEGHWDHDDHHEGHPR